MVALYTGARLQDVTDMRWESVDLQNKWIAFRAGKTQQRIKIPMHDSLHDFLLELPAPDSGKAFLFPTLAGKRTGGKSVFRWRSSASWSGRKCVAKWFTNAQEKRAHGEHALISQLPPHPYEHHGERRSAGRSPTEVYRSCIGGNERHYTHHEIETLRSAIGKLPTVRP